MRTKNYIACLSALLVATACSNQEDFLSDKIQTGDEIQFTATLQQTATIAPRALGNNKGETEVLPYVYDIRIRKIDTKNTNLHTDTQIFNVRTGNYGTLDMESTDGVTATAMKWTDKTNPVDFYAWTVPTGVSIEDGGTSGTVNFGCASEEGNKPTTGIKHDTFNEKEGTPLEVFLSAHKQASFNNSPSVNLGFKHVVSKVSINVRWWTNDDITDKVTITFPFIPKEWKVAQTESSDSPKAFAVIEPDNTEPLSLKLDQLMKGSNGYRTFYLPPLTGENYKLEKAGDFEIGYKGTTYYGSLASIVTSSRSTLEAGEYLILNIQLNPNFNAGGYADIKPWTSADKDIAYANPYRGIYSIEGLKALKNGLTTNNLDGLDSLYIDGTGELSGKKIIRLYNDLTLTSDEECTLGLKENMIFDGLGHTITVPKDKSLFGEITATGVEINNIRLEGAGQLASSLTGVSVYNCHANGTGNLVGTAKDGTTFDFCSAEKASNLLAGTTNGTVTIQNCLVAYDGATGFAGTGGTITAKNSFFFNTAETVTGTYYDENNPSTEKAISADAQTGQLVVTTTGGTDKKDKLIDLLNAASKSLNSNDKTYWVYVYGKTYPVMRIK